MNKKPLSSQCSPTIWKKMSEENKELWSILFDVFFDKSNFPPGWDSNLDCERQSVVAHNLACQAIWLLDSKKKRKT